MCPLRKLICVLAFASATLVCSATEHILFTREGPTQARLFISNGDGSGEQTLTQPGSLDYNPAWSPKGDWIVFTSERGGSANLYRIHPDGTGLDQLTDDPAYDDQAAFSPDSSQIVFVTTRAAGTANLWILDALTRRAKPLTSGRGGDFRPAWSPDGKWIAFSSDRESDLPTAKGRWERLHLVDIYLIRPDGSGLKRLSEHGNFCGTPKWTWDSKSVIAYCMSAEETYKYREPDGEDGETKVVQIEIATGATKPIASGPGVKISPSVLASGEIAYVRRDKSVHGVVYANGKPGPGGSDLHSPSWSPDGTHLVYSRYETKHTVEPRKLWSRHSNYELSAARFLPAYDPTGSHLALTDWNQDDTTSLFIIDEGKPARAILNRKEVLLSPHWSPNGRQIVFGMGRFVRFTGAEKSTDPKHGEDQVGIVNADGSEFDVITSGPNNNAFPSFSRDGKRIVYRTTGPDGEGLRIMNIGDHSVTVLTNDYDNFPVWSPRGDLIEFTRKVGQDFEVFTIQPDGKNVTQLTHTHGNDTHASWSPDGERIVFTSSRMGFKDEALYTGAAQPYGEIFVMKYDGTEVEQLTDNQWEDGGPAWQPHKTDPPTATAPTK
jgi:TolB protein